jgi:23S rRNA (cytosine1962-C5)-methyltransferase
LERLDAALEKRRGLFDSATTGYRLINGESDGWPGLVLDRYDDTLVAKLYATAWLSRLAEIAEVFKDRIPFDRLIFRLSRNILTAGMEQGLLPGQVFQGMPLTEPVLFRESGLAFEADVLNGQKTGFFLDQRENRRRVEQLSVGRKVLNAFSFNGGFSVYAARGGAVSVASLDISEHALNGAFRTFSLNQQLPSVAQCQHGVIKANAFEWLREGGGKNFDLIILDPPSLAKREAERERAIVAYLELARNAITHLAPGGILLACSCSAHVSAEEFYSAIHRAAQISKRSVKELERRGHAPDHPATFKEAEYLKAIYLSFEG